MGFISNSVYVLDPAQKYWYFDAKFHQIHFQFSNMDKFIIDLGNAW